MSEPIKVGDLVVVVRVLHRCSIGVLGKVFQVGSISPSSICGDCNQIFVGAAAYYTQDYAIPVSWLRKIPPLSELETHETEGKVTV